MIHRYKEVSIIYGGRGRRYAEALSDKITKISTEDRYPIHATIINERILTRELLTDVMRLFKESEFCVTFLTKEDCFEAGNIQKKRLRQNVVFEMGMALIELGRERCILLSDFNVKDADFDLPSDMNSLEILPFDEDNFAAVLDDVVDKLLKLSQSSIVTEEKFETIPRYDSLLTRSEYRVDYDNIFADRPIPLAVEGKNFYDDILYDWIRECRSLPHYDEKCVYLLERIGFLPIFGKISAAVEFMKQSEVLIESYQASDIQYYGNTELLDLIKNTVRCVIEYTLLKTENGAGDNRLRHYKRLLKKMLMKGIPSDKEINPLISLVYYDYLGLTYLRIYRIENSESSLRQAKESFLKALTYCEKVDLGLEIWKGFLTYNLARVFADSNEPNEAENYFIEAYEIRNDWLKVSKYNVTVRNALSSEYFIAKIDYIDMCRKFELMSPEEIQDEYSDMEKELDFYSDIDDKVDRLIYVRQLLKNRMSKQ